MVTLGAARIADAGGGGLASTVADTGIGVAPEQLSRLFGRFGQADSSTTRRSGGTGLGPSLVRASTEALGSAVEEESEPGRGSTTVTVPAAPPLRSPPREWACDGPHSSSYAVLASPPHGRPTVAARLGDGCHDLEG